MVAHMQQNGWTWGPGYAGTELLLDVPPGTSRSANCRAYAVALQSLLKEVNIDSDVRGTKGANDLGYVTQVGFGTVTRGSPAT